MGVAAVSLLLSLAAPPELDVGRVLAEPGVRAVALGFWASWCAPCVEAVPKWKALQERHRAAGLRVVIVQTKDGASCAGPGFEPDVLVCDASGELADRFRVEALPAGFAYEWRGRALIGPVGVDALEATLGAWFRAAPRVQIEVESSGAGSPEDLRGLIAAAMTARGKLPVVATAEERAALAAVLRRSLELGSDEAAACQLGREIPPNALLRARVGPPDLLQLRLLSAEQACLLEAVSVPFSAADPRVGAEAAVEALHRRLGLGPSRTPPKLAVAEKPSAISGTGVVALPRADSGISWAFRPVAERRARAEVLRAFEALRAQLRSSMPSSGLSPLERPIVEASLGRLSTVRVAGSVRVASVTVKEETLVVRAELSLDALGLLLALPTPALWEKVRALAGSALSAASGEP